LLRLVDNAPVLRVRAQRASSSLVSSVRNRSAFSCGVDGTARASCGQPPSVHALPFPNPVHPKDFPLLAREVMREQNTDGWCSIITIAKLG
jgi:hypothetical protein